MRDAGIQGLRGCASLSVLLYHALAGLGALGAVLFGWGYAGVDLFFVVSGFILTRRWAAGTYSKPDGSTDLARYGLRRIFRIVPLYYLLLPVLTLGLGVPLAWPDLLFAQNYSLATWGHLVPTWTLCVEEAFYLGLPLWAALWVRTRHPLALATLLGAVSLAWWLASGFALDPAATSTPTATLLAHQLPAYLFDYGLGSLAVVEEFRVLPRTQARAVALLGLALVVVSAERAYVPVLVGGGFALVLVGAKDARILTNRATAWLGDLTYPLYLVGLPLTLALVALGLRGPALALVIPLGVAVAWVLHVAVEAPFVRLGRRLERSATRHLSSASPQIGLSD